MAANTGIFEEIEAAIAVLKAHFLTTSGSDINEVEMARRALVSMLATLDDPFTNYIPPEQLDSYRSRKQEQVVGIGLQFDIDIENRVRVVAPLRGSPADIPQVQSGYELVDVDGLPVRGVDRQSLEKRLNGSEGSTIHLTVKTPHGTEISVSVARRSVEVEYIRWSNPGADIVMARIAWFSGTGYRGFIDTLQQYIEQGARGLVLDLRNNSGGSIVATRNIFSSLCDQPVMYFAIKREGDQVADPPLGEYRFDIPVVVVVNGATFSAGEILAGALQDHRRATIVGETTGGKGSMQQLFPLDGQIGGALRVTTATNCTPCGRVLQGRGIEPDIIAVQSYPELFIEDGPQNISEKGRAYARQLHLQRLLHQVTENNGVTVAPDSGTAETASQIMQTWTRGDQQLARARQVLEEVLEQQLRQKSAGQRVW